MSSRLLRLLLPVATGLWILAIWWIAYEAGAFPKGTVPSPLEVARGFESEAAKGRLFEDVVASLYRVGFGFVGGVLIAVPLGLVIGRSQRVRAALLPWINFFRSLSPIAWIQLSGGMRQRVELGRALAAETDILLMDEPFGALDYQTRMKMRRELVSTLQARPRTVVLVTHDIEEAVQLGDRIVVLAARPSRVRRTLGLETPRPRSPGDAGVAEAEVAIMEELGLA